MHINNNTKFRAHDVMEIHWEQNEQSEFIAQIISITQKYVQCDERVCNIPFGTFANGQLRRDSMRNFAPPRIQTHANPNGRDRHKKNKKNNPPVAPANTSKSTYIDPRRIVKQHSDANGTCTKFAKRLKNCTCNSQTLRHTALTERTLRANARTQSRKYGKRLQLWAVGKLLSMTYLNINPFDDFDENDAFLKAIMKILFTSLWIYP